MKPKIQKIIDKLLKQADSAMATYSPPAKILRADAESVRTVCHLAQEYLNNFPAIEAKSESYRTIVAGSRSIKSYLTVKRAIESAPWKISCVLSGTAKGVDQSGEDWAEIHKIPLEKYPADWNSFGRRAGYMRNCTMAAHGEALIAVWDTQSKGTKHMIDIAYRYGLKVHICKIS